MSFPNCCNGLVSGEPGVANAVHDSTAKMGPIMEKSVDRAQQAIWGLFGVGKNYKNKSDGGSDANKPPDLVWDPTTQTFKKPGG